jgi:hypothetical protein
VLQAVAVSTMQIGPVTQHVHLMHADVSQALVIPLGAPLDRIEQRDGLTVRNRHDQVRTRTDMLEHGLGSGSGWQRHGVKITLPERSAPDRSACATASRQRSSG